MNAFFHNLLQFLRATVIGLGFVLAIMLVMVIFIAGIIAIIHFNTPVTHIWILEAEILFYGILYVALVYATSITLLEKYR
jgi:hypothetical protein